MFGKLECSAEVGVQAEPYTDEDVTPVSPSLELEDGEGETPEEIIISRNVFLIGQPETPRMFVKVSVNGIMACGLIDTGSELCLMHESLLLEHFGPSPKLDEVDVRIKGVGENERVKVIGRGTAKVEIAGLNLEKSAFIIAPRSVNMPCPLILGMDFLVRNGLFVVPGDRLLKLRRNNASGHDWKVDAEGNPLELRLKRVSCNLAKPVEIQPGEKVKVPIKLDSHDLQAYSDKVSSVYLIESNHDPVSKGWSMVDGMVASEEMEVLIENTSSKLKRLDQGAAVGVATTVL